MSDAVEVTGAPCPLGLPCPAGGKLIVALKISNGEIITETVEVHPVDAAPAWRAVWEGMKSDLDTLMKPRTGEMSGAIVQAAARELRSFFVRCHQFKDALKVEAATTRIGKKQVEAAITADPELALLADLATLDKHGAFNAPPRSGNAPQFGACSGVAVRYETWRVRLPIIQGAASIDGLDFAERAVNAWTRQLTSWGLL